MAPGLPWPALSHTQALPKGNLPTVESGGAGTALSVGSMKEGAKGRPRGSRKGVRTSPWWSPLVCLPACLEYVMGMWGGAGWGGVGTYQIVDLVVPPTGHKHHLACLLRDLQRWAAVLAAVQECGSSHVVGQAAMAVPQSFFLSWWEEEPLFPPADVDRPAEGAEDVGMER